MPLPHGPVLAEVPRQPVLLLNLLEVFIYAQSPEGAGDEEQHKVNAIVGDGCIRGSSAGLYSDQRSKTRSFSPARLQDGDKNNNKTKPTKGATSQRTDNGPVQAVEEPRDHVPDAGP